MFSATRGKALLLTRRLALQATRQLPNDAVKACATIGSADAVSRVTIDHWRHHQQHHRQCRQYSRTAFDMAKDGNGDKSKDKEDTIEIQNMTDPSQIPDVQTMNLPDDWTDEDTAKLLEEVQEMQEKEESEKFVPDWKPGMRRRKRIWSYNIEDLLYEDDPTLPRRWTLRDRRCGALAIKVGMMPFFDDWGYRHACTVLFVDENKVLDHKTMDKHGYMAVKVCAGRRKRKNVSSLVMGQYKDLLEGEDENPPYLVREFRVTDEKWLVPKFSQIHARHFVPGQNVDVAGISKGKGFQGAMKRWNFKGQPASHGVSKSHRALGSTGQCQDPGRVFKGKKMAGRMGGERKTVQNLRILKIDRGRNLLYIKGHIPGNNGCYVEVRDAVKKPLWKTQKVQANEDGNAPDRPPLPTFEFDESIDGCGDPGFEEVCPLDEKDPLNFDPDY
mmetsp:Transcript_14183/g.39255  ORF Transcript_14183/g.39255 Transcript_14183/m.39255 type:complete len:443 (-) Transcript_14183:109-1437(-)